MARILVVDDEPDIEQLIRLKFRKRIQDGELEFVFAQNGVEAMERLAGGATIDVVLTDINMPQMDGLTLLQRVEELKNPALKALVVSAYGDMENIRIAMNRGAFDFITKPIDFHDLELTIAKTLKHLAFINQAQSDRMELVAVQRDLTTAARIQQSILPRAIPDRPEVTIHAAMIPAKEVGGDFYDFFFIDNDRLALVIGDVSGKGIPAAILMAMSRTLLKALAQQVGNPGECLRRVNTILAGESDPSMFVTIFFGTLNLKTGELHYCNGGHPSPFILRADGGVEPLEAVGGTLIGMIENLEFDVKRLSLHRGDTILLYTDGVTESMNGEGELYSEARLRECLGANRGVSLQELVGTLVRVLRSYTGVEMQSDDITMLGCRYNGA